MFLENEFMKVTFKAEGGEIASWIDKKTGKEVIYQGNQGWSGQNPTLFPIVGNTFTKTYEIDGKTYQMGNHGLIRKAVLAERLEDNKVIFTLTSSEETLKEYPFEFKYELEYELVDDQVNLLYRVTNLGAKVMPFSFGLHPAFIVPQDSDETLLDYKVRLSNPQAVQQLVFDPKKVEPIKYEDVYLDEIKLNNQLFEVYATLLYQNVRQASVVLESNKYAYEVGATGYQYLAIWKELSSDYICVEPWVGLGDLEANDYTFENRPGTLLLEPNKHFLFSTYYKFIVK